MIAIKGDFHLLQPITESREREGEREVGGKQIPASANVHQFQSSYAECRHDLLGELFFHIAMRSKYLLLNSLFTARFTEPNMRNQVAGDWAS